MHKHDPFTLMKKFNRFKSMDVLLSQSFLSPSRLITCNRKCVFFTHLNANVYFFWGKEKKFRIFF